MPRTSLIFGSFLLLIAVAALVVGAVKVDFFASDVYRLFYVNVLMAPGTSLQKTMDAVTQIERLVVDQLGTEARGMVAYAGQQVTDKELLMGDERGQVFVSLVAGKTAARSVDEIIDSLRDKVASIPGPKSVSFTRRKTGPPVTKPISIKVRGSDIGEIREAVDRVKAILKDVPGVNGVAADDYEGANELIVRLNADAITRAGLQPERVARFLRLFAGGEEVASMQDRGERLFVRVRAKIGPLDNIDVFLNQPVSLPTGGEIGLSELLHIERQKALSDIRHDDFRRAITVEADIDPDVTDTLRANKEVRDAWRAIAPAFPGVTLNFAGELDDIQESLGSMLVLFLLGIGLIYLILGTQFRSYGQPLIVLAALPLAFIGVVFGLGISGNPLSLFTLYGVVALAGIAANDAIVLISAANQNLLRMGSAWPAVAMAARRRFLPIVITSTTTIAGLFSLAAGLGGASLMWGPVATAIVWGLTFSTILTLFIIPVLYAVSVRPTRQSAAGVGGLPLPSAGRLGAPSIIVRLVEGFYSSRAKQRQKELDSILDSSELKSLYAQGIEAMRNNDLESPVRCFEQLVRRFPDSLELNILAAQANLRLMQVRGWDIGYSNRARRYVMRARSLGPGDNRVAGLMWMLEEINESAPTD